MILSCYISIKCDLEGDIEAGEGRKNIDHAKSH